MGHEERFSRGPLPVFFLFLREALVGSSAMGRDVRADLAAEYRAFVEPPHGRGMTTSSIGRLRLAVPVTCAMLDVTL